MNMSESFNYNAPQYVDFEFSGDLESSKYGDDYFGKYFKQYIKNDHTLLFIL